MAKKAGLNRNQLKYLVIMAMLIDHIAWAFVPLDTVLGQVMHFIGRLTGPTMAYFLVEGYVHTRDVKKYALRLGIFALLSWIPFVYFEYGCLPVSVSGSGTASEGPAIRMYLSEQDVVLAVYPWFGVLYTLLLGLLAVWLWDRGRCPKWCKVLGTIGLCVLSVFGDWMIFDILYCVFLFRFRKNPKAKWTAFSFITAFFCLDILLAEPWWVASFQFGVFMVPFLIQFGYNGESGSKKPVHKWFFYVFYPAHLLILGLLKWVTHSS